MCCRYCYNAVGHIREVAKQNVGERRMSIFEDSTSPSASPQPQPPPVAPEVQVEVEGQHALDALDSQVQLDKIHVFQTETSANVDINDEGADQNVANDNASTSASAVEEVEDNSDGEGDGSDCDETSKQVLTNRGPDADDDHGAAEAPAAPQYGPFDFSRSLPSYDYQQDIKAMEDRYELEHRKLHGLCFFCIVLDCTHPTQPRHKLNIL